MTQQDLTLYRGADQPHIFNFFEGVAPVAVASKYTFAKMQVRLRRSSDSKEILTKQLGAGISFNGNVLRVEFPAAELQEVSAGIYWYDLKVTEIGTGLISVLWFGKFELTDNVTI